MLFNLYVNDLPQNCECKCYQFADDTTIYDHATPKSISDCLGKVNNAMSGLENWANDSNLLLNGKKTKQMLVTTQQMSRAHGLNEYIPPITVRHHIIERVTTFKILGTWFNENLKWADQTKHLLSSCYGVLSSLRKLRKMTPQHIKKQLVESLVISKLDYNDIVSYPLPKYLQKKFQRVQNAAASFINNHYCTEKDVLKLGWLPIDECVQYHLLTSVFKAMYNPSWPEYLRLEKHEPKRQLRSSIAPQLSIPLIEGTFQDSASKLFNNLPAEVRSCSEFKIYNRHVRQFLMNKANERINA